MGTVDDDADEVVGAGRIERLPQRVQDALGELAGAAKEGLLALSVGVGLGVQLLDKALDAARDMYRKTIALRVDPANAPAVGFYRKAGFTTVATVVSKKSGKLRLLMSREL